MSGINPGDRERRPALPNLRRRSAGSSVTVRGMRPGDLAKLNRALPGTGVPDAGLDRLDRSLVRSGAAFTLVSAAGVRAVGGIEHPWPSRGIVWFFHADDLQRREWGRIIRAARALLRVEDERQVLRIECAIREADEGGGRLLRRLGFVREARLHLFCGAENYLLFCRIRPAPAGSLVH